MGARCKSSATNEIQPARCGSKNRSIINHCPAVRLNPHRHKTISYQDLPGVNTHIERWSVHSNQERRRCIAEKAFVNNV